MKLVDLLAPERILVPLEVETLREAATALLEALIASGATTEPDKLRERLAGFLPRDVIAVGKAFILHFRSDAVGDLAASLGVTAQPVKGEQDPTKEARLVILLVAPPRETSTYLQAVSAFGRVLSRDAVLSALLDARQPADVLEAESLADIKMPGYLSVRDVMVPDPLLVRPETTLGEASDLMLKHDVRAIPVVSESGEVLGLVTHRELLRYLLPMYVKRASRGEFRAVRRPSEGGTDPRKIPVRDVMDPSVLCVSEDQTLADVATTMINRSVDRFPVVRQGKLVGSLTRGDIVRRLLGK